MSGIENISYTNQEKAGSGGDITAIKEGLNELEKVTETGCGIKEM